MSSAFLDALITKQLNSKDGADNTVSYEVETSDNRDDPTVAKASFKFKKPISEADLKAKRPQLLQGVTDELNAKRLGIMETLLSRYGITGKVGKKRTKGSVNVQIGASSEIEGNNVGIQTVAGKNISQNNLSSLLEVLAKNYLVNDMKKPGAPLKHQTGRFANSLDIQAIKVTPAVGRAKKPNVSVFFSYMLYPYATFDPAVSSQPAMYMNPSYGARNPQKIMGEAIAKASRDIIHARYKINVKQGR